MPMCCSQDIVKSREYGCGNGAMTSRINIEDEYDDVDLNVMLGLSAANSYAEKLVLHRVLFSPFNGHCSKAYDRSRHISKQYSVLSPIMHCKISQNH